MPLCSAKHELVWYQYTYNGAQGVSKYKAHHKLLLLALLGLDASLSINIYLIFIYKHRYLSMLQTHHCIPKHYINTKKHMKHTFGMALYCTMSTLKHTHV